MFVTNHAIDRYIERVLELDLSEKQKETFLEKEGTKIVNTMVEMTQKADLSYVAGKEKGETSASIFYLYRDIIIIVKDGYIVTLYEATSLEDNVLDHYEYINKMRNSIETLKVAKEKRRFSRDKKTRELQNLVSRRLEKYKELFFVFDNEAEKCERPTEYYIK